MEIVTDFFNKTAKAIDTVYFAEVKYYRDNKQCAEVHYSLELFSNGCLTYNKLIDRLAKSCKDTKENIHNIVKNFVVDWKEFEFKVK